MASWPGAMARQRHDLWPSASSTPPCAGHPDCATCKQFSPVSKSIAMWNYTAFIESNGLREKLLSNYLLAEA